MPRPLILLLALALLPFAPELCRAQGDETKINRAGKPLESNADNHDADTMGKMLDSDYVFTDYDGTVLTKGQFLASIRDKSIQVTLEVSENMKLFRHGIPSSSLARLARRAPRKANRFRT